MMGGEKGMGSLPWLSGFRGHCCPPGTRVCPFACRAAGGDGARHLPEPRGPAPCEGGNYGCCQAASSPAVKSLKNNVHRMSHLICLAEKQAGLMVSLHPEAGGVSTNGAHHGPMQALRSQRQDPASVHTLPFSQDWRGMRVAPAAHIGHLPRSADRQRPRVPSCSRVGSLSPFCRRGYLVIQSQRRGIQA